MPAVFEEERGLIRAGFEGAQEGDHCMQLSGVRAVQDRVYGWGDAGPVGRAVADFGECFEGLNGVELHAGVLLEEDVE